MGFNFHPNSEWLEADGLGGFASGTVSGIRTRRYHALLLVATNPPTGRFVLVNGFEAWVRTPRGTFSLTSHVYSPDVVHPDGTSRIKSFSPEPWPQWTFSFEDGTRLQHEVFVPKGYPLTVLSWKLLEPQPDMILSVRPLISGRDYHALHRENPAFCFDFDIQNGNVVWRPYAGVPVIVAASNGEYSHHPDWYRNFLYREERARGLDCTEDLASPGVFQWDLSKGEAVCVLGVNAPEVGTSLSVEDRVRDLRRTEAGRRKRFASRLHRSADDYIVRRGKGKTIIAGYPWFTDWGRDTFIALRGLCLATGKLEEARQILLEWAGALSEGMFPNRFPDQGARPEFNSVDASLWYVIAVSDFLKAAKDKGQLLSPEEASLLQRTVQKILSEYVTGARFGIRLDDDGLLKSGQPGVPLTWMDAKVGDWVVTPRIGKPVEVQALWLNALEFGRTLSKKWEEVFRRGLSAFRERFWNGSRGCLYDVVDADHVRERCDGTLRPNQIFAAGGLPLCLLEDGQARKVMDIVEARLWTPVGLRSLAPGEPGYAPRYEGGVRERDGAYHQGTVWPWLAGPFVEAWVRVRGGTPEAKQEARARFLEPLLRHLDEAGLGHLPEIADGDAPHTLRGCPFQAWSLGEILRVMEQVL